MIEGKGLGGKRINRVNVSLDNKTNQKLNKLATACQTKPTTLARMLIERCLNDPVIVAEFQDESAVYSAYRVIPVNVKGEIEYVLSGGN